MELSASPPSTNRTFLSFIPRRGRSASIPPPLQEHTSSSPSGLSSMLRRSRRDSNAPASPLPHEDGTRRPSPSAAPAPPPPVSTASSSAPAPTGPPVLHRIRLVPHLESTRSLPFEPIIRDAIEHGPLLRVGRFTERHNSLSSAANAPAALKIAFRSKVVSRAHAEIWCEAGGKFFIRDTKSSSGTFLNHVRLATANVESRPFPIKDGDIIQLGIDYQGGQQEIYRCVKIKVEIGREWQSAANAFNANALQRLGTLGVTNVGASVALAGPTSSKTTPPKPVAKPSTSTQSSTDCCICLFPVTVSQALFIAPCSHAFHYKCMRPMLIAHHPGFSCPLCRTFADLDSDVEVELPAHYLMQEEEPIPAHLLEVTGDAGGDEEVEAMVTSENEREASLRRRPIAEEPDDDDDDLLAMDEDGPSLRLGEAEGDEDGHDASLASGMGGEAASASTPTNTTFLSLLAPTHRRPSVANGVQSRHSSSNSSGAGPTPGASSSRNPIIINSDGEEEHDDEEEDEDEDEPESDEDEDEGESGSRGEGLASVGAKRKRFNRA